MCGRRTSVQRPPAAWLSRQAYQPASYTFEQAEPGGTFILPSARHAYSVCFTASLRLLPSLLFVSVLRFCILAHICVRSVLGVLVVDGMHIAASVRVEHVVEHPNHTDQPHKVFGPVAGGALETLPEMPEGPFVLVFDGGRLVQVDGERTVEKEAEAGEWRTWQAVRRHGSSACAAPKTSSSSGGNKIDRCRVGKKVKNPPIRSRTLACSRGPRLLGLFRLPSC